RWAARRSRACRGRRRSDRRGGPGVPRPRHPRLESGSGDRTPRRLKATKHLRNDLPVRGVKGVMKNASNSHADCEAAECFIPTSRRRFLRDTFFTVAGAMVAVGMSNTAALAMPLEFTEAKHAKGQTRSYAVPAADGAQ